MLVSYDAAGNCVDVGALVAHLGIEKGALTVKPLSLPARPCCSRLAVPIRAIASAIIIYGTVL